MFDSLGINNTKLQIMQTKNSDDLEVIEVDTNDDGSIDEDEQDRIISICAAQSTLDCHREVDTSGNELCALQRSIDDDTEEDYECVAVVRRAGVRGNGGFDDGYTAAQNAAQQESQELLTVVGVLGGIIAALVIIIGVGGYFMWNRINKKQGSVAFQGYEQDPHKAVEMVDENQYGQATINVDDDEETLAVTKE